jgi:hypothetical protein
MPFCVSCGNAIQEPANFCSKCGVHQAGAAEPASSGPKIVDQAPSQTLTAVAAEQPRLGEKPIVAEPILSNLRQYKEHVTATCLGCGYQGLMGLTRQETKRKPGLTPWLDGCFSLIIVIIAVPLIFVFPIGTIVSVILGAFASWVIKNALQTTTHCCCPACQRELVLRP